MQIQGNKIILTTFESGSNHYYDSTFNLRPYIEPNSKGLYTVEINEVWGRNNEPTLEPGDFVEFRFHYKGVAGLPDVDSYRCVINSEIFTYGSDSLEAIVKVLNALFSPNADIFDYENADIKTAFIQKLEFKYYDPANDIRDITTTSIGAHWFIDLTLNSTLPTHVTAIDKITMRFSNNFCYLFNALTIEKEAAPTSASTYRFDFYNMRLGGPYLYLIDTSPLQSEMKTINANNQIYNITALAYNNNAYHNGIIQGSSSMRTKTRDLSNLRIRLMNDQFDLVKIKEPLYIQLTVTNDES